MNRRYLLTLIPSVVLIGCTPTVKVEIGGVVDAITNFAGKYAGTDPAVARALVAANQIKAALAGNGDWKSIAAAAIPTIQAGLLIAAKFAPVPGVAVSAVNAVLSALAAAAGIPVAAATADAMPLDQAVSVLSAP